MFEETCAVKKIEKSMIGSCDFCRQYKHIVLFPTKFNLVTNQHDKFKKKIINKIKNSTQKKQTQVLISYYTC